MSNLNFLLKQIKLIEVNMKKNQYFNKLRNVPQFDKFGVISFTMEYNSKRLKIQCAKKCPAIIVCIYIVQPRIQGYTD